MHISQQFNDLNLRYQEPAASSMLPPASASLDYGVNSYGAAPQSATEMHSLPNYGESETVTDAYHQQPHYDDQHQYHSGFYQPGPSDGQPYGDTQSQIYQPQFNDNSGPLSYGDNTNYLNSEVNTHFE